jgi:hypothetical protein
MVSSKNCTVSIKQVAIEMEMTTDSAWDHDAKTTV